MSKPLDGRDSPLSRGQFQTSANWAYGFFPGYYNMASGYGAMSTAAEASPSTDVGLGDAGTASDAGLDGGAQG